MYTKICRSVTPAQIVFACIADVNKKVVVVRRPFGIEGHGGDNIGRFANRQLAFVELFQTIPM